MDHAKDGATEVSQILHSKISTVRRKHVTVATAVGVAAAIVAFALILAVGMMLDLWIPNSLSYSARAAVLAIHLAAVVWIVLYATFRPILYGPHNVEILATADGVVPERGRLTPKADAGRKQDFPLNRITLHPPRIEQANKALLPSHRDLKLRHPILQKIKNDKGAAVFAATIENV